MDNLNTPNDIHRSGTLQISGYASIFNRRDLSGDIVRRGAFCAGLLQTSTTALPMLFGHETKEPIGVWERIFEDQTGLFVSGKLFVGDGRTERIARLIRSHALSGLSIGYRPVRVRRTKLGRELLEIDLWEVSIVAFPMLRAARITQIDDACNETETSRRSTM
ncbi:MAG TPA: HK97 family phage prohead protease [Hellea balneolensis]|uniref:HK97 family phage prohead protease n=1 Tax=Hellea balneolensis TaxID=287478 RepID=A0A7C3G9Z3_9PROT|nr:HK97 family phage prohead protease [Hellea balneolensis]